VATVAGPKAMRRLVDAVMAIGSELELPVMLRLIIESAVDLADATYGALGVLDDTGTRLAEFITVGIDEEAHARIGKLPEGHGILGVLIIDKRPLRLPNLTEHPDSYGFPPNHPPMSSFLGVPIRLRDKIYGNLYLTDKKSGEVFTDVDEELVVGLAAAAGVAIDNARLQELVKDMALVDDRDRIARDLHDSVIQRLFATGMSLHGALGLIKPNPDKASVRVQAAIDDLDITMKQIRTAIFGLENSGSDEESLRADVLAVARDAEGALGFEPRVLLDGPIDTGLDSRIGGELLTTLREALANIARHAGAHRVDISITVEGDVTLEVRDDGVGPGEAFRAGGKGLANMLHRAERLGGTMEIQGVEPSGTLLVWRVPKG